MVQVAEQMMETKIVKVPKVRYEAVHYEEEQVIQLPRLSPGVFVGN